MDYSELKLHLKDAFYKNQKNIRDQRFYALTSLALNIGARVSDLLDLTWNQIDWDNASISYKNKKSKKYQVQVLSAEVIDILKRYKTSVEALGIYDSRIFYNDSKKAVMSRITANRRTQKELKINFHQIRKIAARHIAEQKGVIKTSRFLGHSRVSTTDIYLGVSQDDYLKEMRDIRW